MWNKKKKKREKLFLIEAIALKASSTYTYLSVCKNAYETRKRHFR